MGFKVPVKTINNAPTIALIKMEVRFNEAASTTPIPIKTAGMAFLKLVFFF